MREKARRLSIVGWLVVAAGPCQLARAESKTADLILRGGKVFVGPGRYAEALAVAGNRVIAVGSDAAVMARKSAGTKVVDLNGRAATPGFHDSHVHLLRGARSAAHAMSKSEAMKQALVQARRAGVTTMAAFPEPEEASTQEQFELWKALYESGEASARLALFGRLEDAKGYLNLRRRALDYPRTRLTLPGLKGVLDGSISTRTAALVKPYFDAPQSRAQPLISAWALRSAVKSAHAAGLQVALHAAGDLAVRRALDACAASQAEAREQGRVLPPAACRIEHADVVSPQDLARFGELGAAASMQPARLLRPNEIRNELPNRLGDRARLAFAWSALARSGALVIFGSDWPASPLEPAAGLYAAVERRHLDGRPKEGWFPDEKISIDEAVTHYTADSARALGLGDELGLLKPGYLADIAVWDHDLFAPNADLLGARVDLTVFDGKIVYERPPR